MSRTSSIRDAWHPQTREDREAILLELQEILASPHFCNSKRYPALLQYIVENTLAGRSHLLKERTLGVEVFERPASYDTNADTVVRYTAGEVRKRLSLYYHELGRKPAIMISLPPGSYIPEFLHGDDLAPAVDAAWSHEVLAPASWPAGELERGGDLLPVPPVRRRGVTWAWAGVAIALLAAAAGLGLRYRGGRGAGGALEAFWAPVLRDQRKVLVCSGSVVFKEGNFSGVQTAGKDIDYPFVSSQIAYSIGRVSSLVERNGATMDLLLSATTPLTALREQPLILLGGYNNLWSIRLLQTMPYHFAPEIDASIVDGGRAKWARDRSLPYSSADDYALVARFRETTTDSWVVVLAGLGRNGTEAAAQFATSPHYMEMLREAAGKDFGNRDIEAVLKVNVIEGKTGAPTILAVRVW
jgi:hypothetical protein